MKVKHLVIDAAGFVRNLPLWEYGEELYSVPEVIAELRDKITRQRYESLPVPIKMKEPQPWAIRFVNQFSKKTGDFAVLSLADVKILALTYELEIEARGSSDHLRTEPQKCVIEGPSNEKNDEDQKVEGFHLPQEKLNNLTNSSEILPSETESSDNIMNHSFDNSLSDACDDTNSVTPISGCRDFTVYPVNSSPHTDAIDLKQPDNILWCHMVGLEDFLKEHSYIGGYVPTSDDSNVHEMLVREYPQFWPSRKERSSLGNRALNLYPSSDGRPLHSTFPCIRRWSYHISSFTEEERKLFPSSGREVGDVLQELRTSVQNGEGNNKVPNLIGQNPTLFDSVLQEDMKSLSLNNEEESNEGFSEEIHGEEDSTVLDEGDEADIEDGNDSEELENGNFDEDWNENIINGDVVCEEQNEDEHDDDDDDDDDEGWITPCNIKKCKVKERKIPAEEEEEKDSDVLVACVSSDFAVQNLLKHIGLSVMGVEGKIIRQIRTFTLRCYACFKLCSDMSKIFCPKCGNKTLKRVSVTVNPDGTQKVWINFKKPINTRGMIFSLPRPRGGQHARNPILVADQKEARQFSSKMSKKKINPLNEDYDPDSAPFAIRDVYSRAAQLGYMGDRCHNHYYWEKKNPNERSKKYKKKKK